jgi:hypothetical protein
MGCQVLRCANEFGAVVLVNPPGSDRHETAVCAAHKEAMDAGEPWFFDASSNRYYFGPDLVARNLRRVTRVSTSSSADRLSDDDRGRLKLVTLFYRTVGGDGTEESVEFVLTDQLRRMLADALTRGLRPEPEPDEPGASQPPEKL